MYSKKNKKKWSFALTRRLLAVFIVVLCLPSIVQAGTETLITTDTGTSGQNFPAIDGNWIVWTDGRHDDGSGFTDIYAYNVETGSEIRITPPESYAVHPAISGNVIVWENLTSAFDYDIFSYDLNSGLLTQITTDPANQQYPSIDGSLVVWQDDRSFDYDIYAIDLSGGSEQLLTPDTVGTNQEYPSVAGSLVVWQDDRSFDYDIYAIDLSGGSEQLLTPDTVGTSQEYPSVAGSLVVWQDGRSGFPNDDIYVNDTSLFTENRVNDNAPFSEKVLPAISGNAVVWIDGRNPGYNDIYYKNLLSGSDVSITEGRAVISTCDGGPKISGSRIVWTDYRNDNMDVYLYTLGADETCPVAGFTMSAQSGPSPLTVDFTDTSIPGTTAIAHRVWDFGEGNSTTDELNPSWTYNVPGTYTARLTINNPLCRNMTPPATEYIITTGAAPVAAFTPSVTSGMVPLAVDFTDSSVGATAWNWSFGDGAFSDVQNPSHTYTDGGTFPVLLNASNAFGYSCAEAEIEGLTGADVNADTTITGISVDGRFGGQFLVFDGTILAGYAIPAPGVLVSPPLAGDGWQNITFVTEDPAGFHDFGNCTLMGNISSVILQTVEIEPAGFQESTGALSSVNYSVTLNTWPENGILHTQIWEGYTTADLAEFRTIVSRSGYTYLWDVAYTTKISKTNFPASGTARLFMSVNSSWADRYVDRDHTFAVRLSDDRATGEVITARYLSSDPVKDLDYFTIDSPHGFSTFGLTQLSGSGNPLQLITMTVTSHLDPYSILGSGYIPSGSSDSDSGTSKGEGGAAQAAPPAEQESNPGTGVTGTVYTNPDGVVTRATTLVSADNTATLTMPEGVVALDAEGNPLGAVTITTSTGAGMQESGSTVFTFEGLAFELGPDGATFSPAITLIFTPPQASWGREYTVRSYDRATGTWQDLPTTFDPATGQVTAQVTHFCCFGLFSRQSTHGSAGAAAPVAVDVPVPAPTPSPPPSTAISIFTSMMLWAWDLVLANVGVIIVICVALGALVLYYWKSRSPF